MLNFLLGLVANLFLSFSFGPISGEIAARYEIWVTPKGESQSQKYSQSFNLSVAKATVQSLIKGGMKAELKGPFIEVKSLNFDPSKKDKPSISLNGNVQVGLPGGPGVTISGSAGTGQKPTIDVKPGTGPTAPTTGGTTKPTTGGSTTSKPTTGGSTTGSTTKPTTGGSTTSTTGGSTSSTKPTTGGTTTGSSSSNTKPSTGSTTKPSTGSTSTPPAPKPSATPWVDVAKAEIGVKEVAGSKHNPRIVEYHQTTSLKAKDDETAWCSSFANWVMKQAGETGTNSAAARSWLNWGKKIDKPVPGAIVVFWRGSPTGTQGHVGFYMGEEGNNILVLGGNQSNGVNISKYSKSQLLGYRMPN